MIGMGEWSQKVCAIAGAIVAFLVAGRAGATCPAPRADQVIRLSGRPFAAEPTPDNCTLFVSLVGGEASGSVAVLTNHDGAFQLTRTVKLQQGSGGGLNLSHDGALLAVAAEDAVSLLNVAKLETPDQDPAVATLPEGDRGAIYVQFSKDDALLFASEERNASLAVIDVAAVRRGEVGKALIGRVPVGQAPVGLALSPDGERLYSTSQSLGDTGACGSEQPGGRPHATGALVSIDVAKAGRDPRHAVVGALRAGCNPVRVVISPDGRYLWVSERGDDHVLGLDPAALAAGAQPAQVSQLKVGRSPVGLAIRSDGAQLWVANSDRFASGDASLALITPAQPGQARVVSFLKVGAFPRDLRFLPDGRTLVVALFGSNAVLLHPTERPSAP